MKYLRILLSTLGLGLLVACGNKADDNTLRVGMELSYPPFEMTDERNNPTGISVDLAHALGKELNRPVDIVNTSFAGLISSLKTGKIDLIISSMTATEERAQSIAFSDPYLDTGLCILVAKDSDIESMRNLDRKGVSIAVKQGTTGHLYAMENIRNAMVLPLEKETSAVLEVVQGKADAFIYDQMSVYRHWKRQPDHLRPILLPFQKESWAIGLRQGDEELLQRVNAFLARFREDGGFETLGDRYLNEEKKAFKELGYPFFF